MFNISEGFSAPLQDKFHSAWDGVIQSKISNYRTEPARVVSYSPLTDTAEVILDIMDNSNDTIRVKTGRHYQGPFPGTGEACGLYPGQRVSVCFLNGSSYALFNQGFIVGTDYTRKDSHAPAYAPWLAKGEGTVVVHPTSTGKWGNAEFTDSESNVSKTSVGKTNIEEWGHEHTVVTGTNTTRSQAISKDSSKGLFVAANKLRGVK